MLSSSFCLGLIWSTFCCIVLRLYLSSRSFYLNKTLTLLVCVWCYYVTFIWCPTHRPVIFSHYTGHFPRMKTSGQWHCLYRLRLLNAILTEISTKNPKDGKEKERWLTEFELIIPLNEVFTLAKLVILHSFGLSMNAVYLYPFIYKSSILSPCLSDDWYTI